MNIFQKYESFHISPGVIFENNWKKNLPFYKQIYPGDHLDKLIKYRNDLIKEVDLDKVMERHYHPDQRKAKWKKEYGGEWTEVTSKNWTVNNWHNLE